MNRLIWLCFFIFQSTNLFALDNKVFTGQYPSATTFQKISLEKLKTYFETLAGQSINNIDPISGVRTYQVRRKNSLVVDLIFAKIERQQAGNKLVEGVYYSLSSGRGLVFIFTRYGLNLKESTDRDLLLLNFLPSDSSTSYSLEIPILGFYLNTEVGAKNENSYISLKQMAFELKIESVYSDMKAQRNYLFYFKPMPSPQSSLTVQAEAREGSWSNLQYLHFSSSKGLITPNLFFQGLDQGSSVYEELGGEYLDMINYMGFPVLSN